jgi:hypothetical protein
MIIYTEPQGTPGWYQNRCGVITGSMFPEIMKTADGLTEQQLTYVTALLAGKSQDEAKALANYKAVPRGEKIDRALAGEKVGDWTTAAKDYAFRIAVERISGITTDDGQFETWAMRRGKELEPLARQAHEATSLVVVEECGFMSTDDRKFGVSVDGLVGDDEGVEYKCFIDPAKLRSIHMDNDIGDVHWQVQGGLWLTGRKRWHFGLYCPALKPVKKDLKLITFDRDEDSIENLEKTLVEFDQLVESYIEALSQREAA